MLNQQSVITDLVREFPQLASSGAWKNSADRDGQWFDFAHLVRDLYEQRNYARVQAAFDCLEEFLDDGNPELRAWVAGFLQALQEVSSWGSENSEAFSDFLGARARRVSETLQTIRFDLADCSILEAEVLMWRVVHHPPHVSSRPSDTRPLS
jgi:hypothetical protein